MRRPNTARRAEEYTVDPKVVRFWERFVPLTGDKVRLVCEAVGYTDIVNAYRDDFLSVPAIKAVWGK